MSSPPIDTQQSTAVNNPPRDGPNRPPIVKATLNIEKGLPLRTTTVKGNHTIQIDDLRDR